MKHQRGPTGHHVTLGQTTATAQHAYRVLHEYIAPALRELGFRRGPSTGGICTASPALSAHLVYPWEVSSGGAIEPVAREVLRVFGSYGWLAIQAALDNPGYPKDPDVRWPRTFPKIPRGLFHDEVAAARRSRAE